MLKSVREIGGIAWRFYRQHEKKCWNKDLNKWILSMCWEMHTSIIHPLAVQSSRARCRHLVIAVQS